jgi:galactose mutarotase-like enzyme
MKRLNEDSEHTTPITLLTDEIAVTVVSWEGGRIASLRSLQSGLEFLTQARPGRPVIEPGLEASFQRGPCAGVEECLPTVGPCADCTGGPAPDHGDFWQIPWQVDSLVGRRLEMHAIGFSRPLRLERVIEINDASLLLSYRVVNVGPKCLSFLYAWHPLFAVEAGDRVVLPPEVSDVTLSYSRDEAFGREERDLLWPVLQNNNDLRDLSVAMAPNQETAEMIYTRRLHVGRCGLFRQNQGQGVIVSFDPSRLPYLGIWLCFGGWPVSGLEPKQVAIALEPTTAPCNTLSDCERAGLAVSLAPECSFTWDLQVDLTSPGLTYQSFIAHVHRKELGLNTFPARAGSGPPRRSC